MNQPTWEDFNELREEQRHLKEEVRKLREQITEPIQITRLEIDSGSMHKRLDVVQEDVRVLKEDVAVLKIEMQGARADILQIRESQADLRDKLKEHGQHLKAIESKQDAHTEILGNLMNLVESHDAILKTVATKDDIASMATKDDIASMATKDDITRLERLIMQLLQQSPKE